jgi:shikimate dehydrogenase
MTHQDTAMERVFTLDQVRDHDGPPLVLFVGISTGGSRVHQTFPAWAPLFAPGSMLRGVDLPEDSPPSHFRALLGAMAANPCVLGAVVTSHKLRLYRACHDLLRTTDPLVELTGEVNALDTRERAHGFARDPQSLDVILDQTVGDRPVVCIGAGGSATALLLAMGLDVPASLSAGTPVVRPQGTGRGHLTIVGKHQDSLDQLHAVQRRSDIPDDAVTFALAPEAASVGRIVASAPPGAVIANATGLGKTGPGSPLPNPDCFPRDAIAWDFNYRGPLTFLEQARAADAATIDGWDYFVAGWSAALAAITQRPLTTELLAEAIAAAAPFQAPRSG